MRLADAVPSTWFRTQDNSIWVSGYRVFRVSKEYFSFGLKMFDLNQIRIIIHYGKVKYPNPIKIEPTDDYKINFTVPDLVFGETKEGAYLLLLTPFDVNGTGDEVAIVKEKISAAIGLLVAVNGRNMAYEHLFDFIELKDKGSTSIRRITEHPLHFRPPDINEARLNVISEADKAIAALPKLDQNRIYLSLRWFESAIYSGGSIDAYLKYWFAIETLGMPNTTNIRPLVESLSRIYGLSNEETQNKFSIGRLFGLRSRIVHGGQMIPIRQRLSMYLEAIYVDILYEHLGLVSERRAIAVIDDPNFELKQYLYEP